MAIQDHNTPMRHCKQCGNDLPLTSEFWHKDSGNVAGFCYTCKECAKKRSRKWGADNMEQARANAKRYAETHREEIRAYREATADRIAANKRAWRKANAEKVRAQKNASQKRNRAAANERTKRSQAKHPERRRLQGRIDAHRRRHAPGNFTAADVDLQFKAQGGNCWWCGKPLKKYHVDHRIPLAKGGTNDPRNLCLACPKCNQSKNAKLPSEWIGRLL